MNTIHVVNPIPLSVAFAGLTEFVSRYESEKFEETARRDAIIAKCKLNGKKAKYAAQVVWKNLVIESLKNGSLSYKELGKIMDVSANTTYGRLSALEDEGIVVRTGRGDSVLWALVD